MEKLGYIVSERKLNNIKGFVEVINDVSLIKDSTKPVLFVGLENARKNIDNFSILEKNPEKNIFWTFKKTEKRLDFEHDIDYFYKFIINNISSNIKYYYINILNLEYSKIKKLHEIVFNSNEKRYIYISNEMIYILYNEKNILGISLNILEYIGINKNKILDKLYNNQNNVICNDVSKCLKEIKHEINDKSYLSPFFMSIFFE